MSAPAGQPSSPSFDVIVVGAGPTGCAAAIKLAQLGREVLLVERADEGGAKNLSGGILWGNDLAKILPDWMSEAPLERPVTNKKIGFLGAETAFVVDYHDERLKTDKVGHAVLRAKFDKWLLEKARAAGVTVVTGVNVDDLYRVGDTIRGVIHQGEVTLANIVILAEGANSRLALAHGLHHGRVRLDSHNYALGVKEVLKLPKGVMEERFGLKENDGVAGEFVVGRSDGVKMGGFLYTNKDTISLGVVINLHTLETSNTSSHELMEEFRNHPYILKLTEGAKMVEYGAHLVPEGGYAAMPELYRAGLLLAGDCAGFCFSNGVVIQGMNYGIRSAIVAAETAHLALAKGDFSEVILSKYEKFLDREGILADFKRFKNVGEFLWNDRMFSTYPNLFADTFKSLLQADGPKMKARDHLKEQAKKHGVKASHAMKDAISAGVNF